MSYNFIFALTQSGPSLHGSDAVLNDEITQTHSTWKGSKQIPIKIEETYTNEKSRSRV